MRQLVAELISEGRKTLLERMKLNGTMVGYYEPSFFNPIPCPCGGGGQTCVLVSHRLNCSETKKTQ